MEGEAMLLEVIYRHVGTKVIQSLLIRKMSAMCLLERAEVLTWTCLT